MAGATDDAPMPAGPYAAVPGLVETVEAHGETTLVVDPARLLDACFFLRDELGFRFLSDVSSVDYLGWGEQPVAGYIGTPGGRDINRPAAQGLSHRPAPKPKRFAMVYHLLRLAPGAPRLRVKTFVDDGEPVESVIPVWPTADWHEREVWDLMGVNIVNHPNRVRILLDEDWEGHPLRKDYPVGGEPVRFSGEE